MPHNLLPYIIISAFVAFLDLLPLLFKRRPWRYNCSLFLQVLITGLVVFTVSQTGLPWWAVGSAIAIVLALPQLVLPSVRGAYPWYAALINYAVVGLVFSLIKQSLPAIAGLFS